MRVARLYGLNLRFAHLAALVSLVVGGRAFAQTDQFTAARDDSAVTCVVVGASRGFSEAEMLAMVRRGVERGLRDVNSRSARAAQLQWTIRDPGHPARAWLDLFVPAHDGQAARHASESVAASAAPAGIFVKAVATLTARVLTSEPPQG
jgi:hypothetical protein